MSAIFSICNELVHRYFAGEGLKIICTNVFILFIYLDISFPLRPPLFLSLVRYGRLKTLCE